MGRKTELRRACAKEKQPTPEGAGKQSVPQLRGCQVPDPISCILGSPVDCDEEGRKMECTNTVCPFKGIAIHDRCFEAYENHLIKVLSSLGSARGWTDGQRRANLWEKKGQSLVGRLCKCRCGSGNLSLDHQHDKDRARREREALEQQNGLKKKKHKKESKLPVLNPGGVKGSPAFVEPKGKKLRQRAVSETESEVSSSFASEYLATRRESHQQAFTEHNAWNAGAQSEEKEKTPKKEKEKRVKNDRTHKKSALDEAYDDCDLQWDKAISDPVDADTLSVFSECEKENVKYEPAPVPAPLTRSFAAAAKSDSHPLNLPLTVQTDMNGVTYTGMDSGIEMKSSTTSVSDGDHPSTPPGEPTVRQSSPAQPARKIPGLASTPLTSKAAKRAAKEAQRKQAAELAAAARLNPVKPRVPRDFKLDAPQVEQQVVETVQEAAAKFERGFNLPITIPEDHHDLDSKFDVPLTPVSIAPVAPARMPSLPSFIEPTSVLRAPATHMPHSVPHRPAAPGMNSFLPPGLPIPKGLTNGDSSSIPSNALIESKTNSAPAASKGVSIPTAAELSFKSALSCSVLPPMAVAPVVPQAFTGNQKKGKKAAVVINRPAPPPRPASPVKEPERPVTPNDWEDELPPEWVDLDSLPLFNIFQSTNFLLGETIIAQKYMPGFW